MSSTHTPEISLVIPAFNEDKNLPILAAEIGKALEDRDFEVIFVDDGSRDGSREVLKTLSSRDSRIRVIRFSENQGQSAAFDAGFRAARAPVVVTLDADLQNDPADIPRLLEALEGCDMVSGIRTERRDSRTRRAASRVANALRRAAVGDSVTDVGCGLKAYRTEFVQRFKMFDGLHRYLPSLVLLQGGRIREVPVRHRPRIHGESKYTIGSRLWHTIPDLFAVRWMQKRWIDERLAEEIGEE